MDFISNPVIYTLVLFRIQDIPFIVRGVVEILSRQGYLHASWIPIRKERFQANIPRISNVDPSTHWSVIDTWFLICMPNIWIFYFNESVFVDTAFPAPLCMLKSTSQFRIPKFKDGAEFLRITTSFMLSNL